MRRRNPKHPVQPVAKMLIQGISAMIRLFLFAARNLYQMKNISLMKMWKLHLPGHTLAVYPCSKRRRRDEKLAHGEGERKRSRMLGKRDNRYFLPAGGRSRSAAT